MGGEDRFDGMSEFAHEGPVVDTFEGRHAQANAPQFRVIPGIGAEVARRLELFATLLQPFVQSAAAGKESVLVLSASMGGANVAADMLRPTTSAALTPNCRSMTSWTRATDSIRSRNDI